jgi:hypothetical protein
MRYCSLHDRECYDDRMEKVEEGGNMVISAYTGLIQTIQDLRKKGFTANFEFLDHVFTDVESGRTFTADHLAIIDHRRFEGMSDPDDMSVLYAIESNDGTKGIIVDAFGTYADPELGDFLQGVRYRERSRLQALAA